MSQAVPYLAEIIDSDNNIKMSCVKEKENILKVEVKSRHKNRTTNKCFSMLFTCCSGSLLLIT